MTFKPFPVAPNYPVTPSQWRDFYNRSKVMVIPHYKTGELHFVRIMKAIIPKGSKNIEYGSNFHGEVVDLVITTTSGKKIGICYCNGLPKLSAVKYPVLQVDMNDAITNQQWLKPA